MSCRQRSAPEKLRARRRAPALAPLLALALAPLCTWGVTPRIARTITLRPEIRIAVTNRTVHVQGRLSHEGDAIAEAVRVVLQTPFGHSLTNQLGHLDPRDHRRWSSQYRHPRDAPPGRHALVVRLEYEDAEGQPFDTVYALPYDLGGAPPAAPAAMALEPVGPPGEAAWTDVPAIEHQGQVRLTLTPLGQHSVPATLRLYLPGSLALVPPLPAITRLPEGTETVLLTVTNRSALAGSRLPLAAVLETSVRGRRHTAIAQTRLTIAGSPPGPGRRSAPVPPTLLLGALLLWLLIEVGLRRLRRSHAPWVLVDVLALTACTLTIASQLAPQLWLVDSLTVGGDTPAHHYLASHLRSALREGRVVSWAPGWWSGFPMYRFYFPLPYLVMALLRTVLSHEVAFKLGSVAGLFALPFSAYWAGRMLRLERPLPAFLALATLPLLLDTTHTMWGVNVYSTLAGMVANSYSFALLPAALASAVRDLLDTRPRLRTLVLLALTVLSHFFTAIILALVLALLFAGRLAQAAWTGRRELAHQAATLIPLGLMTFLVCAWWLLPLAVMRPWSVDFGDPWTIHWFRNLPLLVRFAALPALVLCGLLAFTRRGRVTAAHSGTNWGLVAGLHGAMLLLAAVLFRWGLRWSEVFVNCRLWPFIVHALLVLTALALGALVRRMHQPTLASIVCGLAVLAFPWDNPNHAPDWAVYNFSGLEALREGAVVEALANELRDTPGRLAYDLHPGNEQLGSSRIFELMPHLCGKPILEGGIVNSALGALAAYSVQGEISDEPAGWPKRVRPRRFDPDAGLRRIELMGATHFIARSRHVQAALDRDPAWSLVADHGKWHLFANTTTRGELVRVWKTPLPHVETEDPQGAIVDWLSRRDSIASPRLILRPGEPMPPAPSPPVEGSADSLPDEPPPPGFLDEHSEPLELLTASANRIRFRTTALGQPHLVAMSYFPNWRVRGARHLYLAAPGFMVVYPEDRDVELRFERTPVDWLGSGATALGLAMLVLRDRRRRRTASRLAT